MAKKRRFVPRARGPKPVDMRRAAARPPARTDAVWERAEANGLPALAGQEALIAPGRIPAAQVVEELEEKIALQEKVSSALQEGRRVEVEPVLPVPSMARPKPSGAPGRALTGRGWLARLRKCEYVGEAVDFLRDVWRGEKTYMVTFFDPRGGCQHVEAYPSIQQRLDAAKFLSSKGIPAQAPEIPSKLPQGIKSLVLVTREDEPPV